MQGNQTTDWIPADQLDAIRKKAAELIDRADSAKELAAAMRLLRDVSQPAEGSNESPSTPNRAADDDVRKSDVAEFFGVALQTVQTWVMRGMPSRSYGPGIAARFNLRECAQWFVRQRATTEQAMAEQYSQMPRKVRDELLDLKLGRLRGELVEAKLVKEQMGKFSVRMRQMVEDVHRVIGPEGVEALNRIADALIEEFGTFGDDRSHVERSKKSRPSAKRRTHQNGKSHAR